MEIKSDKQKNIAVSAALNIIRQAAMIAFPLISYSYATRTLGADGIGVYEFAQSIVSYFALLAALGVLSYAVRDGAKYKAAREKSISASGNVSEGETGFELGGRTRDALDDFASEIFSINLIMTFVSYGVMLVLLYTNSHMYGYRIAIMIASLSILFTTIGVDWVNSLFEDYLYLTIRYIAIQLVALVLLFVFVKDPDDLYRYIFISILATVLNGILNAVYVRRYVKIRFTFALNLKSHALPVFILFCNQIALVIYLNSDITILNFLTDDTSVGLYGVAAKIYTMIKTLLNAAIFVVIPRFSQYVITEDSRFASGLKKLLSALFTVLLPACVGLFFMAGDAVFVVSGSEFESAGAPLRVLAVALLFAVLACYFANAIVMPCKLEKYFLASTVAAAVLNIVLNFIMIPKMGMIAAAITTLAAEVLVFVLLVIVSSRKVRLSEIIDRRDCLSTLVGSVVVAVVCIFARKLMDMTSFGSLDGAVGKAQPSGIIGTLIIIALALLCYLAVLVLMKNSLTFMARGRRY